jgi:hypothetical protein
VHCVELEDFDYYLSGAPLTLKTIQPNFFLKILMLPEASDICTKAVDSMDMRDYSEFGLSLDDFDCHLGNSRKSAS